MMLMNSGCLIIPENTNTSKDLPFFQRMIYKDIHSTNTLGEPLPSKVAHRGSRWVKVGFGNHSVKLPWGTTEQQGDIDILHFPFRNKQQILEKIRLCEQTLAHSAKSSKICTTWKTLGDELNSEKNGSLLLNHYCFQRMKFPKNLKRAT